MALDPNIPLQARGIQLESPIAQAGNVLGILNALGQQRMQQLQMQEAARKVQIEQQMMADRNALGPNPSQENLLAFASKWASPGSLLTTVTASQDRAAARDQRMFELQQRAQDKLTEIERQAAERRITQEEAARQRADLAREMQAARAQASQDLARLGASLRQPPQPTAPVLVPDPNSPTGFKWADRASAIGQPAPAPTASSRQQEQEAKRENMAKYAESLVERLETLGKSDPRSVAGPLSGPTRFMESTVNAAWPGAIGSQATIAKQTRDRLIAALGEIRKGSDRLSNMQQQRLESAMGALSSGTPAGLQQGILDTYDLIDSMQGKPMRSLANNPAGANVPPPPLGFTVDKK